MKRPRVRFAEKNDINWPSKLAGRMMQPCLLLLDKQTQLFAPHNLALADPEVGPAARTEPHGRIERGAPVLIDGDIPAWSDVF